MEGNEKNKDWLYKGFRKQGLQKSGKVLQGKQDRASGNRIGLQEIG